MHTYVSDRDGDHDDNPHIMRQYNVCQGQIFVVLYPHGDLYVGINETRAVARSQKLTNHLAIAQ
jgi:hypothetical protein